MTEKKRDKKIEEEEKRRGQQGVQGFQGIEGEQGLPGEQGKPGVAGVQGEPGVQGIEGEPGTGEQGVAGLAGAKGLRGRTGSQPRSVLLAFWAVILVTSLVLAGLAYTIRQNRANIHENHRLAVEGQKAHNALCALNNYLLLRVKIQRQYLRDHPNDVPPGTASLILLQIDNQQKTVDAVSPTLGHCPPVRK